MRTDAFEILDGVDAVRSGSNGHLTPQLRRSSFLYSFHRLVSYASSFFAGYLTHMAVPFYGGFNASFCFSSSSSILTAVFIRSMNSFDCRCTCCLPPVSFRARIASS
ncbi:hypothetical protein HPP92_009316 [Vanilla planifolia]|uniref:Transmembrane protein n=1 Tax=Vanilla planifolia TaxID=51239 RepID=A0A835R7L8_VANPL|nr:hypothetical protein HPP92_009316 [Vanilla planifolia]